MPPARISECNAAPRIHILRPPPTDVFQWLQGFACPIYQVLDAETNRPPGEVPLDQRTRTSVSTSIRNVFSVKLVTAQLGLLHPGVHMGRDIPSKPADEIYLIGISSRIARVISALMRRYPEWMHQLHLCLASEERLCTRLQEARDLTDSFLLYHLEIEGLLPQEPAIENLQKRLERVSHHLLNLRRCLGLLDINAPDGDKQYDIAWEIESQISRAVELARRGIPIYMMPGSLNMFLTRAAAFREAEIRRSAQEFVIAPKRDLVYLTDPQHPDLFVRLWKHPWCRDVERLALLICDCKLEIEWYNTDIEGRIDEIWSTRAATFLQGSIKEIMLVVRPETNPDSLPRQSIYQQITRQYLISLPRDEFGFVDFDAIAINARRMLFSKADTRIVRTSYETYASVLEKLSKSAGHSKQDIKIRRVVDIDYQSTGQIKAGGLAADAAMYRRTQRGD